MTRILREEIAKLSADEKYDLLDTLLEGIEADPPPLTDEQEAELDRREAEHRANPSSAIPWEEVKARLAKNRIR